MSPRAWIVAGWVFIAAAAAFAAVSLVLVLGGGGPPAICVQPAGVSCPNGASSLFFPVTGGIAILPGLIFAVGAGVAFFSALACFFWAAHLRTLDALRALVRE